MEQKALENIRAAVGEMQKFKENLENTVSIDGTHRTETPRAAFIACNTCSTPGHLFLLASMSCYHSASCCQMY